MLVQEFLSFSTKGLLLTLRNCLGLVPSTAPEVLCTVVRDEESEDQKREAGPSWDRIAS